MIRYILGFKVESSPCGSFCLCNEEPRVSDVDRQEIALDVAAERTADAADRGEQ